MREEGALYVRDICDQKERVNGVPAARAQRTADLGADAWHDDVRRARRVQRRRGDRHRRRATAGRHVPGRRGEPDRHRRRVFRRARRGNHRRGDQGPPRHAAAVQQGADGDGRRPERRRPVPAAHHRRVRGEPAPPRHRPHRHLSRARMGRADPARGDAVRAELTGIGGQGALPGGVELRGLAAHEGARGRGQPRVRAVRRPAGLLLPRGQGRRVRARPAGGRPGARHPGVVAAGRRAAVRQVPA